MFQVLLAAGADLEAMDGYTVLHKAAISHGRAQGFTEPPGPKSHNRGNPAAEYNNPAVSEVLLAAGAEVNARDEIGRRHDAAWSPAVSEVLLAAGAEVNGGMRLAARPCMMRRTPIPAVNPGPAGGWGQPGGAD